MACGCKNIYRADFPDGTSKEFTGSAAEREAQRAVAAKGGTVTKVR